MIHTGNCSLSGFAHHPINHRGKQKKGKGGKKEEKKKKRATPNLHLPAAAPPQPCSWNKHFTGNRSWGEKGVGVGSWLTRVFCFIRAGISVQIRTCNFEDKATYLHTVLHVTKWGACRLHACARVWPCSCAKERSWGGKVSAALGTTYGRGELGSVLLHRNVWAFVAPLTAVRVYKYTRGERPGRPSILRFGPTRRAVPCPRPPSPQRGPVAQGPAGREFKSRPVRRCWCRWLRGAEAAPRGAERRTTAPASLYLVGFYSPCSITHRLALHLSTPAPLPWERWYAKPCFFQEYSKGLIPLGFRTVHSTLEMFCLGRWGRIVICAINFVLREFQAGFGALCRQRVDGRREPPQRTAKTRWFNTDVFFFKEKEGSSLLSCLLVDFFLLKSLGFTG